MTSWILRTSTKDVTAPDAATLYEWIREGRARWDSLVFNPIAGSWMLARDVPEIAAAYAPPATKQSSAETGRESGARIAYVFIGGIVLSVIIVMAAVATFARRPSPSNDSTTASAAAPLVPRAPEPSIKLIDTRPILTRFAVGPEDDTRLYSQIRVTNRQSLRVGSISGLVTVKNEMGNTLGTTTFTSWEPIEPLSTKSILVEHSSPFYATARAEDKFSATVDLTACASERGTLTGQLAFAGEIGEKTSSGFGELRAQLARTIAHPDLATQGEYKRRLLRR